MNVASCAESHGCSSNVTGGQGCWTVVEPGSSMKDSDTRKREYRSTRICGQADQPWQLWHSLNTLMGACDKNRLPKNCLSAQQFGDFFESKVATVRKATAGGSLTQNFHQRQRYLITFSSAVLVMSGRSSWDRHQSCAHSILYQQTC